jgi:hypothetical protein
MGQGHHSPNSNVNKSVTHFCSVGVEKSFVYRKWRRILNGVRVKIQQKILTQSPFSDFIHYQIIIVRSQFCLCLKVMIQAYQVGPLYQPLLSHWGLYTAVPLVLKNAGATWKMVTYLDYVT